MAKRKKEEFTCTVEFTEGAQERITDAFVEMYYKIKDGIYEGPLLDQKNEESDLEVKKLNGRKTTKKRD